MSAPLNVSLTDVQLQELAKSQGQKLGFLIAKSPVLNDKEKEALLNVVSEMSPDQLDELTVVLEAQYMQANTEDLDKELAKELEAIDADYHEKVETAQQQALGQLNQLKQDIIQAAG